jgi:hypothetical protein
MDSQIWISARGAFSNPLDIRNRNAPGSPAGYGMSKSTCGANCSRTGYYQVVQTHTLLLTGMGRVAYSASRSTKEILWDVTLLRFVVCAAWDWPPRNPRPKSYLRARI